jgi:Asp-tRNA(Asn)/Glu-tRNA(Gln) amidotransferase A subunit family amidase
MTRDRLRRQWRDLFHEYDVVLCPVMPTPAFPHDHSSEASRKIQVDVEQANSQRASDLGRSRYPAGSSSYGDTH